MKNAYKDVLIYKTEISFRPPNTIITTRRYGSGKKYSEFEYVDGDLRRFIRYYENGSIYFIDEMLMGNKHGKCIAFQPPGELLYEREYYNGVLIRQ